MRPGVVAGAGANLIGILEAAYREDGSDEEWLARIVELARPSLDEGLGVTGFFYDVSNAASMRVWSPVFVGTPPGAMEALYTVNALAPATLAQKLFRVTPSCATMTDVVGARVVEEPLHRDVLAPLGILDFLSVAATDPSGAGCLIGAPLPRVARLARRDADLWNRIAAHLAAGARLRRSRASAAAVDDPTRGADAIMTPDGELEHATEAAKSPAAREALKRSAKEMDTARGALRNTDPEAAIAMWTALVSGRWTLVDHFDHDGQRYVVARRNDPEVAGDAHVAKRALTKRERQVLAYAAMGHANKLIAYELGLSPSTVAMHLSSASSKLGATSRVALIRAYKRGV